MKYLYYCSEVGDKAMKTPKFVISTWKYCVLLFSFPNDCYLLLIHNILVIIYFLYFIDAIWKYH